MLQLQFNTRAAALNFAQRVDTALGYPRDGVDVGNGVHAPRALAATQSYFGLPEKHPTLNLWAYPYLPEFQAVYERSPVLQALITPVARIPSWEPPIVDPATGFTVPTPQFCVTCGKLLP